jgi:hypothetical protein
MNEIVSLVEAAFVAKRQYGPTSDEFKRAQNAGFKLIDRSYDVGAKEEILVNESSVLPAPVKIVIEKKGAAPNFCSFVLEK